MQSLKFSSPIRSVVWQELYDPNVKKVTFCADQARDLLTKAACARLSVTLLAFVPLSWPHETMCICRWDGLGRLKAWDTRPTSSPDFGRCLGSRAFLIELWRTPAVLQLSPWTCKQQMCGAGDPSHGRHTLCHRDLHGGGWRRRCRVARPLLGCVAASVETSCERRPARVQQSRSPRR